MVKISKLLLLEDDEVDSQLIERSLKPLETEIVRFSSAKEACAYLENNPVDIILSDLNVSDTFGIETFFVFYKRFQGIPIIILSGYTEDDIALQAVKEGAQDFVRKAEIRSGNLIHKIKFAIERSKLVEQLRQSREELVRESAFKSEFLVHFSHEIRTPLNAVIGNTSILELTHLDKEQTDLVKILKRGAERLLSIVNDILDISKIEAGKLDVISKPFNLREMVGDVLAIFSNESKNKTILISEYVDPKMPSEIESDEKRIKQILLNLISNAIKFTEEGHISIAVTSTQDGKIKFTVEDSGRGISDVDIAKIFSPFMQIYSSDMNVGTGLGLVISQKLAQLLGGEISVYRNPEKGSTFWFTIRPKSQLSHTYARHDFTKDKALVLSNSAEFKFVITKYLASRKIDFDEIPIVDYLRVSELESKTAKPYTVIIIDGRLLNPLYHQALEQKIKQTPSLKQLPVIYSAQVSENWENSVKLKFPIHHSEFLKLLAKSLGEGKDMGSHSSNASTIELQSFAGIEALVVDDDPINRKIISKILSLLHITSQEASNGKEAIEKLQTKAYHIVFMDCAMPIMDGLESARTLRGLGFTTPIVALTANAFDENKTKCIESGMNSFLSKPITAKEVSDVVQKTLKAA
jgi:two-component system sensor histidine kinase/response regulator